MNTTRKSILAAVLAAVCLPHGSSAQKNTSADRERLIGAWHLVSITGPDGKLLTTGLPDGMLIYTQDGHVSVQLMYPKSDHPVSNEYVQDGYEASFGTYELKEATHTLIHHIHAANTGARLIGKDLPRLYEFNSAGRLLIRSASPDEHWSVTWEHY